MDEYKWSALNTKKEATVKLNKKREDKRTYIRLYDNDVLMNTNQQNINSEYQYDSMIDTSSHDG